MEVVIKECLANGRLAGEKSPVRNWLDPEAHRRFGPDQLAIAAALAQPWATRVLLGAVTQEHIRRGVEAASAEVVSLIDSSAFTNTAEDPETYWSKRSQRGWE